MEASSLRTAPGRAPLVAGAALLRLKGDEQLVTLVRRGHDGAFEVLFRRYQPRLLAFCRHMLGSTEDAEDVLQESFASAHRAMIADERPIVARAWLYRIARNRCLDHLRRPAKADGQDSMDVFERGCGVSSEDLAHQRAEIRDVMGDIRALPEAQRSALLMREIDTLSHEQIAAAMETTVSSVKSLLVRARISLVEGGDSHDLIRGGDGNDNLSGGDGPDRIFAGQGVDKVDGDDGDDNLWALARKDVHGEDDATGDSLSGGAGDDRFHTRDGEKDTIDCGDGRDRVLADYRDEVLNNCETVIRRPAQARRGAENRRDRAERLEQRSERLRKRAERVERRAERVREREQGGRPAA